MFVRGSVIEGIPVLENTVVDKQNQAATEVTPVSMASSVDTTAAMSAQHTPQQSTERNLGHFAARLTSDGPGCLADHATLDDRMKGL